MTFGSNLEQLRKENNISQAKLGDILGLTQQMVSSYEKGQSSPNVEILCKMADVFNVSIDALVGYKADLQKTDSSQARLLRYFYELTEEDREKSILIIKTLLQDRGIDK